MPRKTYKTAEQMADSIAEGRTGPGCGLIIGGITYSGDVFYSTISGCMDHEYGKYTKRGRDPKLFSEVCRILETKHKIYVHS